MIYPSVPPEIESRIGSDIAPVFLAYTSDDNVPRSGGVKLYEALNQAGVSAELHIYATGGHGYGLGIHGGPIATWPTRFHDWLKAMEFIDRK